MVFMTVYCPVHLGQDGEGKALEPLATLLPLLPLVDLHVSKFCCYVQKYLKLDARLMNGLPCGCVPTSVFLGHPLV